MGEKFLDNKRFSFPARHCRTGAVALIFTIWLTLPILVSAQTIATSEYAQRRTQMLERIQDGLLLLHARPTPKEMEQPGWIQDPTFFYFTGFKNLPGQLSSWRQNQRLGTLQFGVQLFEQRKQKCPRLATTGF